MVGALWSRGVRRLRRGLRRLGDASVRALERESGAAGIDARRFRIARQLATDREHVEDEWEGVLAAVGAAEIRIGGRCPGVRRRPAIPTAAYATSRRCR